MPYEPLHHKYRPQSFAELVGQEAIATTLSNALRQQRVAPAYLFTGARGTGKTSSARIFAKSLNCQSSDVPTPSPCGKCEVCRAIALGSSLDVIEIDAASNTGVDNIRELIERAQFAPVQCRYKVYVIDECLTGDSLVLTQNGLVRLDDPTIEGKQALSYNESSGNWEFKRVVRWLDQGERDILEIQTSHRKIRCTGNHLIRTDQGWVAARDVSEGVRILSPAPAAVERLSTNSELTGDYAVLPEGISLRAIPTVKGPTALSISLSRLTPSGPSAAVDVEKNWISQNSSSKKGKGLGASNVIGNTILIRKATGFGSLELKNLSVEQERYHQTSSASSMEPFWGTVPSAIPTPIADFQGCHGLMAWNSEIGWSTRQIGSAFFSPNLELQAIEAMEQPQSVAEPSVILGLQKCSTALSQTRKRRLSLKSGSLRFPQKGLPGGTWTMAPSALVLKEAPKFSSIQKAIPLRKTISSLNGSVSWAIPSPCEATRDLATESNTSTLLWEQMSQDGGYQLCPPMASHLWTTNLETVVFVRPAGVERVYDIEVEDNHNFVANGLLVHNCHMLSAAAFNALLKTLEEPPERVIFVLATTDPQRVLPTIISRCQRFDFRRIPLEAMVAHLGAIAQKEAIPITDDAIQLVAQLSQGGLRDAESSLDQLSLLEGEITPERVWDLVGAVPEQDLLALMEAIAQDQPEALIDRVRQLMDRGREPSIVLQNLASFYRDLLIAKTAPNRGDLVAVTTQTWNAMVAFVSNLSIELLQQGQKRLRESEAQIRNSAQPRLWLEVTLLGLLPSAMGSVAPGSAIAPPPVSSPPPPRVAPSPPPAAPAPAAPTSAPPPPASPPPPPTPAPAPQHQPVADPPPPAPLPSLPEPTPVEVAATVLHLEQTWQQVLGLVQPNSTQILLRQQCFLLAYDGQEARIGVKAAPLLKIASSRHSNIEAAFEKYAGQRVRVTLEVSEPLQPGAIASTPARSAPPTPTPPPVTAPSVADPEPPPVAPSRTAVAPPPPMAPPPEPSPAVPAPEAIAPPSPPPIASRWEDDPLVRAANNVASFFNGQVVRLDGDLSSAGGASSDDWTEESSSNLGDEGDDVPF